jgi:predicted transcriptional regulator
LSEKISEVDIGKRNHLITCQDSCIAKEAFQLMAAYDVTSLPILDLEDSVCGVISATDILYARKDTSLLSDNVVSFVSQSRKDANVSRDVNSIVSCNLDDDLTTVLRIMMHEEVHHIYILQEDKLIGVISFVDILKHFCK